MGGKGQIGIFFFVVEGTSERVEKSSMSLKEIKTSITLGLKNKDIKMFWFSLFPLLLLLQLLPTSLLSKYICLLILHIYLESLLIVLSYGYSVLNCCALNDIG